MPELVELFVIRPLLFPIFLRRDHDNHVVLLGKINDFVRVIPAIRKKVFGRYVFNQSNSFLAISSGTLCDKNSDRHTKRIHGKVKLGVEPPFVRAISWFPPFAPDA